MVQINLLPWREQVKQEKKTQFGILIAAVVVLAIICLIFTRFYYKSIISNQLARNQYLQQQLEKEQTQLTSLIAKKNEQEALQASLNFLIGLRQQSYGVVQLLDALIRAVPESVTLQKIMREGNQVTMIGVAKSDAQISLFMENLAKIKIFDQPNLTKITANPIADERVFQVKVELK